MGKDSSLPWREGLREGGKIEMEPVYNLFTLPLIPSHQGRGNLIGQPVK
jgi:hypothetical protein